MANKKATSISIVILSLLLAAALATTIVLAAFTAQKTATTTIQFADGLTLTLSGNAVSTQTDTTVTFTVAGDSTGRVEAGPLLENVSAQTNRDAWVKYTLTPTVGAVSGKTAIADLAIGTPTVSEGTVTWTISSSVTGKETLGTITMPVGSAFTATAGTANSVVAISNAAGFTTATPLFTNVTLNLGAGITVNDFANVQIGISATFDANDSTTNPFA